MSEYQSYEFVALDRPLSPKQMEQLRRVPTRAEISPTRFWNEYHWGDLKADPATLVERYFDAHLYVANWGAHRLILKMPTARLDVKALKQYFGHGHAARFRKTGDHVTLDLTSDIEEPDDDEMTNGSASLAALSPLRAELLRGDLRPAYLAWLLAVQQDDLDDEATEPPVPAGLEHLTAAQQAMVDFFRIDIDLVAAAASGSKASAADDDAFRRWVARLTPNEKDAWLKRAAHDPDLALGSEMLRTFRGAKTHEPPAGARRRVADLRTAADTQRDAREQAELENMERARAAAHAKRERRLVTLGRGIDAAWAKLEKLVESSAYDDAVELAVDLRDLAARDGKASGFAARFETMRKRQLRRRGFFDRWKVATRDGRGRT